MKNHLLIACLLLSPSVGQAALEPAAARKILADYQNSVITVRCVLKAQATVNGNPVGLEREKTATVPGTIVNTEGWVVVSGFQLNPMAALFQKPIKTERGGRPIEVEMKSRIESLRYRLTDESELSARVLTEDQDLGLALLAPDPKPGETLPKFRPVAWDRLATASLFTHYLVIGRGGEAFKNEALIDGGTIGAVVDKPRRLYLQDYGHLMPFLGAPFVDLAGRLIGLGAMSLRPPEDPTTGFMESWPATVIVPATEVRDWVRRVQKAADSAPLAAPVEAAVERFGQVPADLAASLQKQNESSVVVVEGTVKFNCGRCAEEHETNVETVGSVFDASGLVVVGSDGKSAGNKYLEQNLRFILSDRSEVPARFVLQDDDLQLAVLAPAPKTDTPAPAFRPLALAPAAEADVFADVVILSRLDRARRYLPAVALGRVITRVTKPRPFLKITAAIAGPHDDGLPVFLPDGRVLGILAPEPEPEDAAAGEFVFLQGLSFRETNPMRVVPVAALIDLVEQARQARAKAN